MSHDFAVHYILLTIVVFLFCVFLARLAHFYNVFLSRVVFATTAEIGNELLSDLTVVQFENLYIYKVEKRGFNTALILHVPLQIYKKVHFWEQKNLHIFKMLFKNFKNAFKG